MLCICRFPCANNITGAITRSWRWEEMFTQGLAPGSGVGAGPSPDSHDHSHSVVCRLNVEEMVSESRPRMTALTLFYLN